jgi:hypothetical protein
VRGLPLAALLATGVAGPVAAQPLAPFATFNQSPIVQVHGLPAPGEAQVIAPGRARYVLQVDRASNYSVAHRDDEAVLFDGETTRGVFAYSRGLGNNFELGIELPYVTHSGGSLDDFIIHWHDTFGLPQGGRVSAPRNQLDYSYVRDGRQLLALSDSTGGLGDVRLSAAWQWRRDLALRAQLKLANGDAQRLLGSGGVDLALWASGQLRQKWFGLAGAWYGSAGLLLMGDGEVLAAQQRRVAPFGSLGAGLRPLRRLALKLQLDFHGALYKDSALKEIAANAVQLVMGADVFFSPHTRLTLGVVEDLTVNASPDVVFHAALNVSR